MKNSITKDTEHEGAVGALVTCEIGGERYAILQKRTANDSFPGCLQVTVHGKLEKTKEAVREGLNRKKGESMIHGLQRKVTDEVAEMMQRSTMHGGEGVGGFLEINTVADCKLVPMSLFRETFAEGLRRESQEELIEMLGRSWPDPSLRHSLGLFISANVASKLTARRKFYQELRLPGIFVKPQGLLMVSRKKTEKGGKLKKKTDATFGFEITSENLSEFPDLLHVLDQFQKDGVVVLLSANDLDKLIPLDPKLHKKDGVTESGKYGMFQDEIDAVKKALEVK